jgi:hypothetical protein
MSNFYRKWAEKATKANLRAKRENDILRRNLIKNQELKWEKGQLAECLGKVFVITEVMDLGEFGVKLGGHPDIAGVNAFACTPVVEKTEK